MIPIISLLIESTNQIGREHVGKHFTGGRRLLTMSTQTYRILFCPGSESVLFRNSVFSRRKICTQDSLAPHAAGRAHVDLLQTACALNLGTIPRKPSSRGTTSERCRCSRKRACGIQLEAEERVSVSLFHSLMSYPSYMVAVLFFEIPPTITVWINGLPKRS